MHAYITVYMLCIHTHMYIRMRRGMREIYHDIFFPFALAREARNDYNTFILF